jgi:hypothetical protein
LRVDLPMLQMAVTLVMKQDQETMRYYPV